MHEQSHTIVRLQVHLPNEQNVYFTEDTMVAAAESATTKDTTLTAWFKLNESDETATDIFYADIPQHFVFDNKNRKWKRRQRGADTTIGRMYSVNLSSDTERYCLRLLLLHVTGATSFEDLKTYDDEIFDTFKKAAQRRGLFNDDATWDDTLNDAIVYSMPKQLRHLFAYICVFAAPPNVIDLFNKYKTDLSEDFQRHPTHTDDCNYCENQALLEIQRTLILHGKKCANFDLPTPNNVPLLNEESYNADAERERSEEMIETLNPEQLSAFQIIMAAVEDENLPHRCFFLDGPGGTGKTHLYITFLSTIRGQGNSASPVASTGIASNLLPGGRTYFSLFKLPVPLLDNSTSSMRMTSQEASSLRESKLLLWDESTMAPSVALTAVDKLLQEVMTSTKPFGNKVLLLGGDFRQTLPVVPHGSQSAIVESSIKSNPLWGKFTVLKLQTNVRSVDPEFSDWLIRLGNGELTNDQGLPEDTIEIPQTLLCDGNLIIEIFGETMTPADAPRFAKMAILCPKNIDVDKICEEILERLEGNSSTYFSSDSIDDENDDDTQNYPVEFLHEQTPSGMPKHKLNLKIGAIIMLLRNLNTKRGLCNGTRLVVTDLKPNLIIARVLTGSAENETVFVPRIDLASTSTDLPFILRRRQFPVKLAFAMTINKSQGQTLDKVGIFLPEPVFSHGQLYVAFSRVKRSSDVRVKITEGPDQGKLVPGSDVVYTKNVVYKEIYSR
jgi:hypothetical protein